MRTFVLLLSIFCGCSGVSSLSPRYIDPSTRDAIDPDGKFPGVHLRGLPRGWDYLAAPRMPHGGAATVTGPRYDAIIWMSAFTAYDAPGDSVDAVLRMRKHRREGEWLIDVRRSADTASVTHYVESPLGRTHSEVQVSAYRRIWLDGRVLDGAKRDSITVALHGRWPREHDGAARPIFDRILRQATYESP